VRKAVQQQLGPPRAAGELKIVCKSRPCALSCLSAEGWPCAGYFDPANPVTDSSVWLGMHASKCPPPNDRMIGRAAPTNMWVMSIQYDFSERMVLLTVDATYIQRRKKIKNKLASLEKNQMNK
jgi:hypothetical protein